MFPPNTDATANIVTQLATTNQILGQTQALLRNLFPRSTGTFTLGAAVSTTVTDANATTASIITPMPLNAAAGTLMGSAKSLYFTRANGSFVVSTASGVAAVGTEQFAYSILNPL